MYTVALPYPPSVNHYWRRVGTRTLISRRGREFRSSVVAIVANDRQEPMLGPLSLDIEIHPPDRRRRDIDNLLKSLLDAMEHAGVYEDDSQVVRIAITRREVRSGGMALVSVQSVH